MCMYIYMCIYICIYIYVFFVYFHGCQCIMCIYIYIMHPYVSIICMLMMYLLDFPNGVLRLDSGKARGQQIAKRPLLRPTDPMEV